MINKAFFISLVAMLVGLNSSVLTDAVDTLPSPELVKFLAPVVAGLLSKFLDRFFAYLDKRALKRSERDLL
jgi:hypothetical protein